MGTKLTQITRLGRNQIRGRLIMRGYTFRAWALARGYKPRTVTMAVERYAGRGKEPRGKLARAILWDLAETIDRRPATP